MANWEVMHECEDECEAETLKKRQALVKESVLLDKVFSDNSDELLELLDPNRKDVTGEAKAVHDMVKLAESNWFHPTERVVNHWNLPESDLKITSLLMKRWQAQVKEHENMVSASRLNAADASRQFAPENLRFRFNRCPAATTANMSDLSDVDKLLLETSKLFKLNREQDIAFRIMAKTYIFRKILGRGEDSRELEMFPMRMFLTGPGGTGKCMLSEL
ncbi:uncharacterized protein EV420DRAFT_1650494 [Desarmillaria tabescens]|uniref:Uncharacterized protein n=1 Tax=Armillaria tabescens TaxID=1929756 RepID=A0AA39JDN5_ARMTA|nr:uncharacterized protein EV420DRAFT_1650494 [Desarmillaria tabescens]KAK0440474.1 hypothetical protein EV420DRAFT_1650494 [Desarmillaria tabescens]